MRHCFDWSYQPTLNFHFLFFLTMTLLSVDVLPAVEVSESFIVDFISCIYFSKKRSIISLGI